MFLNQSLLPRCTRFSYAFCHRGDAYQEQLDDNGRLTGKFWNTSIFDKWILRGEITASERLHVEIDLAIADSEEEIKLLAAVLGIGEVHEAPAFRTF